MSGPVRRALSGGAVALALLVAACGGGGTSGTSGEGAQSEDAMTRFADCMREHGIEDFPDPEVVGGSSGGAFEDMTTGTGPASGQGSGQAEAPELSEPAEEVEAASAVCRPILDDAVAASGDWERVEPGGDCQCADGSEFSYWTRDADPSKVVLYLQGGGACWSAETCDPEGANEYETAIEAPPGAEPSTSQGIFDFADERNPFADWSFVFVPYCTGDLFLGNATTRYTDDLTIEHKGYVDGTAALDGLAEAFPDASEVVVVGSSAGSAAAPLYGGLAADRLPDARVTVLADSSGAYPDDPGMNARLGGVWGTADAIPDWPENAGLTTADWSLPGLYVQSGHHDPDILFARHDYAYDANQAAHLTLAGVAADDLLSLIDANEAQVEAAGVDVAAYTAPGDGHLALNYDRFYTETVDGTSLVDWVTDLVAGHPGPDVHCATCGPG